MEDGSYTDWECLRRIFTAGANRSRVIIMTRDRAVATLGGADHTLRLDGLGEEDSCKFFSHLAFEKAPVVPVPEIEEIKQIGKKIAQKCKGLLISIKTLAYLLRAESDVKQWKHVLVSSMWGIVVAKKKILPALGLSYCHLSAPVNAALLIVPCSLKTINSNGKHWCACRWIKTSSRMKLRETSMFKFSGQGHSCNRLLIPMVHAVLCMIFSMIWPSLFLGILVPRWRPLKKADRHTMFRMMPCSSITSTFWRPLPIHVA